MQVNKPIPTVSFSKRPRPLLYEFQSIRERNPEIYKPDLKWLQLHEKIIDEDESLDEHDKFCEKGSLYCRYNERLEEYKKYYPLQKKYELLELKLIQDWIQEMSREEQREFYDDLDNKDWHKSGGLTIEESIIQSELKKIFRKSKIETLQESVYRQRRMDFTNAKTKEEKFAAYQCLYD